MLRPKHVWNKYSHFQIEAFYIIEYTDLSFSGLAKFSVQSEV